MDPVVPIERWPRRRGRGDSYIAQGRLLFGVLVVAVLVLLTVGVDMYTDWLWFGSLGLSSVYGTVLSHQVVLFFAAAALFLALYLPSALLARRLAHSFEQLSPPDEDVLWAYIARVGRQDGRPLGVQPDRLRRHPDPRRAAGRHHGLGRVRPVADPGPILGAGPVRHLRPDLRA